MFGSLIDDTGYQLHSALERLRRRSGRGVYLRQREHSLDLVNQFAHYAVMNEQGKQAGGEPGNELRTRPRLWCRRANPARPGLATNSPPNKSSPQSCGARGL